ncbi:hypothetical protein BHE74_00018800 [Ensete ventricosum]|nr:hypothetical protein BHE74_00018800 [Ensete ventricosum]
MADLLPFFSIDLFLLHTSPSLFHGSVGPTAVSLPSTSLAYGSVAAASTATGVNFCIAFSLHMVCKFVSFLSNGGRSPASLTVEVLLLSTVASLPSLRPSSSSPPLLAGLPWLPALTAVASAICSTTSPATGNLFQVLPLTLLPSFPLLPGRIFLFCRDSTKVSFVLPYRLPLLAQTHCQDPCRLPPEHLILLPLLSAATVMNNQRLAFVVHSLTLTPATCPLTSSFGVTSVFFHSATTSYATTVRPNLPAIEVPHCQHLHPIAEDQ